MILLSELDVSQLLLDKIKLELDLNNRIFQISLNGEIKYFSTNIKDSCLGLHLKLNCLESGKPYIVSLSNGKEIGLKTMLLPIQNSLGLWGQACKQKADCDYGLDCKAIKHEDMKYCHCDKDWTLNKCTGTCYLGSLYKRSVQAKSRRYMQHDGLALVGMQKA